eukprot:g15922.t1
MLLVHSPNLAVPIGLENVASALMPTPFGEEGQWSNLKHASFSGTMGLNAFRYHQTGTVDEEDLPPEYVERRDPNTGDLVEAYWRQKNRRDYAFLLSEKCKKLFIGKGDAYTAEGGQRLTTYIRYTEDFYSDWAKRVYYPSEWVTQVKWFLTFVIETVRQICTVSEGIDGQPGPREIYTQKYIEARRDPAELQEFRDAWCHFVGEEHEPSETPSSNEAGAVLLGLQEQLSACADDVHNTPSTTENIERVAREGGLKIPTCMDPEDLLLTLGLGGEALYSDVAGLQHDADVLFHPDKVARLRFLWLRLFESSLRLKKVLILPREFHENFRERYNEWHRGVPDSSGNVPDDPFAGSLWNRAFLFLQALDLAHVCESEAECDHLMHQLTLLDTFRKHQVEVELVASCEKGSLAAYYQGKNAETRHLQGLLEPGNSPMVKMAALAEGLQREFQVPPRDFDPTTGAPVPDTTGQPMRWSHHMHNKGSWDRAGAARALRQMLYTGQEDTTKFFTHRKSLKLSNDWGRIVGFNVPPDNLGLSSGPHPQEWLREHCVVDLQHDFLAEAFQRVPTTEELRALDGEGMASPSVGGNRLPLQPPKGLREAGRLVHSVPADERAKAIAREESKPLNRDLRELRRGLAAEFGESPVRRNPTPPGGFIMGGYSPSTEDQHNAAFIIDSPSPIFNGASSSGPPAQGQGPFITDDFSPSPVHLHVAGSGATPGSAGEGGGAPTTYAATNTFSPPFDPSMLSSAASPGVPEFLSMLSSPGDSASGEQDLQLPHTPIKRAAQTWSDVASPVSAARTSRAGTGSIASAHASPLRNALQELEKEVASPSSEIFEQMSTPERLESDQEEQLASPIPPRTNVLFASWSSPAASSPGNVGVPKQETYDPNAVPDRDVVLRAAVLENERTGKKIVTYDDSSDWEAMAGVDNDQEAEQDGKAPATSSMAPAADTLGGEEVEKTATTPMKVEQEMNTPNGKGANWGGA